MIKEVLGLTKHEIEQSLGNAKVEVGATQGKAEITTHVSTLPVLKTDIERLHYKLESKLNSHLNREHKSSWDYQHSVSFSTNKGVVIIVTCNISKDDE